VCERLADHAPEADAWPLLCDVLAARPDARRADAALRWLVGHPGPDRLADCAPLLQGETQPSATRVALLGLLGRDDVWADAAGWPILRTQLRLASAGDIEVLKAGIAIARAHPSVAFASDVIALLPAHPDDDPLLAMQVGGVLWAWGERATGVAWPSLPNARGPWQRWWAEHGARVRFR
jgi:hypothetical protein